MFLDIETLPAHEEKHEILKFLHAKKRMKRKKTDVDDGGDFEQYLLNTSFDGTYGRILCIAYAINDEPVKCLCNDPDEKKTLEEFWAIAKNCDQFVGHNIMDFDMRFIMQRSVVHGIPPTRFLNFARYRSDCMYDVMKEWVHWSMGGVGLEAMALALGIPTPKDGIDGSQVWDFYKAGKTEEICEYCKRDVECTREVYRRMTFQNKNIE